MEEVRSRGVVRMKHRAPVNQNEYPDYLAHFGVKGMKWGVRRWVDERGIMTDAGKKHYGINAQELKRTAAGMTKDLNRLDKEQTRAKEKSTYYQVKFDKRRSKKEYKAAKRGKEAPELTNKEKKLQQKANGYKALAERGKKFTDQILAQAKANGRSIHMKDVKRHVAIGRTTLKNILGNMLVGMHGGFYASKLAVGKKYKVKNDGKGTVAYKKKYDPNEVTKRTLLRAPSVRRRRG